MPVSYILNKQNNNLTLVRLIAAALVIYGHANALVRGQKLDDFVYKILAVDYSGGVAVKIFFF